jgi:hypothetical protein
MQLRQSLLKSIRSLLIAVLSMCPGRPEMFWVSTWSHGRQILLVLFYRTWLAPSKIDTYFRLLHYPRISKVPGLRIKASLSVLCLPDNRLHALFPLSAGWVINGRPSRQPPGFAGGAKTSDESKPYTRILCVIECGFMPIILARSRRA